MQSRHAPVEWKWTETCGNTGIEISGNLRGSSESRQYDWCLNELELDLPKIGGRHAVRHRSVKVDGDNSQWVHTLVVHGSQDTVAQPVLRNTKRPAFLDGALQGEKCCLTHILQCFLARVPLGRRPRQQRASGDDRAVLTFLQDHRQTVRISSVHDLSERCREDTPLP